MHTDKPFALHITWTCYGTWLPGDARGHVSNMLLPRGGFEPKQNVPGAPYAEGDPYTQARARRLQKEPTVWLSAEQARVVVESLVTAARKHGWRIARGAVMANHVHVIVMDCPDDGPSVRRVLKGMSQAALSEHAGQPGRWWTAGGSDRYKHGAAAVEAAIQYVADQDRKLVEIVDTEVRS